MTAVCIFNGMSFTTSPRIFMFISLTSNHLLLSSFDYVHHVEDWRLSIHVIFSRIIIEKVRTSEIDTGNMIFHIMLLATRRMIVCKYSDLQCQAV